MKNGIICALLLTFSLLSNGQDYELKSTTEIYRDIQELQRGLRVLYIAAHPDDENTRLISWLENDQHVETAYLSLTRGQGGQNLIGDEKGDALGVIRTYELLEARKVDGGEQFFTRAIDFGYSKSAKESFAFWGKEDVLQDVVYVIRKFRPHIIITRFPSTSYAGHGHHEASAILAEEAFDLAGDKTAFPSQFESVNPWKPTSLYHNTSSWWDKSLDDMSDEALESKKMHRINIGVYNDLRGKGMNEIASLARSKHRCQAFGTPRRRGVQTEYLQFLKGDWKADFIASLSGIWEQSPGHAEALSTVLDEYNFTNREADFTSLRTHVYPKMAQRSMWALPEDMQLIKQRMDKLKLDLSGVRIEVFAGEEPVVVGNEYPVTIELYNSSSQVREVRFNHDQIDSTVSLAAGEMVEWQSKLIAPLAPSNPFWLEREHSSWLYNLESKDQVGMAVEQGLHIPFVVVIDGEYVSGSTEVHRRWNDRSIGEISEPLVFVNPVAINPKVSSLVIKKGTSQTIQIDLVAQADLENVQLQVNAPESGWGIAHDKASFSLKKGQVRTVNIAVSAQANARIGQLNYSVLVNRNRIDQQTTTIDYEHIPFTMLHDASATKLIPLDLENDVSKKILYVEGSGDEVDDALELIGYQVDRRSLSGMTIAQLNEYDAVVTGIRAFNRNAELAANLDVLMAYVMNGGHMVVQYNTTYDLNVEQIGPYPLELSRDRVTDENAKANLLMPTHSVFTTPNELVAADWENWVQERGLYFAGTWDDAYKPLISWNDLGEDPVKGALLVASYGTGSYMYSGISFFRQLPAGVPGAYRLLVNLIEYTP